MLYLHKTPGSFKEHTEKQQAVSEPGVMSQTSDGRSSEQRMVWEPPPVHHGLNHGGILSEALDMERKAWEEAEVTSTECLIVSVLIAAESFFASKVPLKSMACIIPLTSMSIL